MGGTQTGDEAPLSSLEAISEVVDRRCVCVHARAMVDPLGSSQVF